jgi:transposase
MAKPSMAPLERTRVTVGVDTHKDLHVARAKDQLGRLLGENTIPTTPAGYRDLLDWARAYGDVEGFGVEGTGSYGAGLSRFLLSHDQVVIEVNRPSRQARRRNGKSDPADADAAASAVLSGDANATPKTGDAHVEMVRALRIARQTAIKARTQAINAMKALVVTAPSELRESLRGKSTTMQVRACARFRPGDLEGPIAAVKVALRSLATRCETLEAEIACLERHLDGLLGQAAPDLLARFGVGADSAGALLVAVGDNPDRLRSEAAFSMLCGSSPVEASSGQQTRHRLNRGGDRQANAALHRIVMARLRWDQRSKDYLERRTKGGMSKREIIRCLKRYVAREIYGVIKVMQANDTTVASEAVDELGPSPGL